MPYVADFGLPQQNSFFREFASRQGRTFFLKVSPMVGLHNDGFTYPAPFIICGLWLLENQGFMYFMGNPFETKLLLLNRNWIFWEP